MLRYIVPILLISAPTLVADDDAPKSTAAKKAKIDFNTEIKKLDDEYQKKINELRLKYLKDLEPARVAALASKDLNEAMRILAEQKEWSDEWTAKASFQIVAAWYGNYDSWHDVTAATRRLVKNGELRLAQGEAPNKGNTDPSPGQHKALVVVYRNRGAVRVALAGDSQPLVIPAAR